MKTLDIDFLYLDLNKFFAGVSCCSNSGCLCDSTQPGKKAEADK
jgi:hypothetical protein